jgi:hypothetical protein
MAINTGLAQLSEALWAVATGTYMLAVVAYTGEYAFGRSGRVAKTAARTPTRKPELVGASVGSNAQRADAPVVGASAAMRSSTASSTEGGPPNGAAEPTTLTRDAGRIWGRWAIAFTLIGLVVHLSCVVLRGVAVDRVPWGNMYEFTLVVALVATIAWLATLARMPQLRYLGLFVMLPVLLLMFLAGTLYTKASKLVPALQSYWLAIHVSSIAVAEGILVVSAAISTMYLVRNRYERLAAGASEPTGRFGSLGSRLPAAAALDKAAYRTVAFAFPIYTAGDLRRDLGRSCLGPLLGLGSEGDLGIHRMGDLCALPACSRYCGLAWRARSLHQPARLRRDDVQLLRRQHRDFRTALLRRLELIDLLP